MNFSLYFCGNKGFRLLYIYECLNRGEILNKDELSKSFNVTVKTIQRDIEDLRTYLSELHFYDSDISIKYDRIRNGYYLVHLEREW